MTKLKAGLLALSMLVIGLCSGLWINFELRRDFFHFAYESQTLTETGSRIAVLKALRAADTERAILILESALDRDVIGISSMLKNSTQAEDLQSVLTQAARYRQGTQYASSEPTVAAHVSDVLKPFYKPAQSQPQ